MDYISLQSQMGFLKEVSGSLEAKSKQGFFFFPSSSLKTKSLQLEAFDKLLNSANSMFLSDPSCLLSLSVFDSRKQYNCLRK